MYFDLFIRAFDKTNGMRFLLNILCVSLLFSCSPERGEEVVVEKFSNVQSLTSDIHSISEEILLPRTLFIANNFLIIYKEREDKLFDVYDLPGLKHLYSFGTIGEGPNDFMLLDARSFRPIENGFQVLEAGSHILKTIRVDSQNIEIIKSEKLFEDQMPSNGFYPMKDNMYLSSGAIGALNEYVFFDRATQTFQEFGEYPEWSKTDIDQPFQLFTTYLKNCVVHPDGDKFASFYGRFKRFRLYNIKGNLLKDVNVKIEPYTTDVKDSRGEYIYYATSPRAVEDKIYAVCFNSKPSDPQGNQSYELQIWDWEGNPISCYKLDKEITYFDISKKYNKIYGINQKKENEIYIYDLPE